MSSGIFETIKSTDSLEKLEILETNIQNRKVDTPEIKLAIANQYAKLGRILVQEKTGLLFDILTAAEAKIVTAVSFYAAIKRKEGKPITRTYTSIRNNGLLGAAEVGVSNNEATLGYEALVEANLTSLSYEQIIVDHQDEFSERAIWYAKDRLGLPNSSAFPPASSEILTQQWTEIIFDWLIERARNNQGRLFGYSNQDIADVLDKSDMSTHGRSIGNMQSRIDFACFLCNQPPLGLCVNKMFPNAWKKKYSWEYPIEHMIKAAQSKVWSDDELEQIRLKTRGLSGTAKNSWVEVETDKDTITRDWALGLKVSKDVTDSDNTHIPEEMVDDLEGLNDWDAIIEAEKDLLNQKPTVKERTSKTIERGKIGSKLKKLVGYKCQICDAMGHAPQTFKKKNGIYYVEAHHVMPVSELEIGSLSASNIIIVCPNHHRELHYGVVGVEREETFFVFHFPNTTIKIDRLII